MGRCRFGADKRSVGPARANKERGAPVCPTAARSRTRTATRACIACAATRSTRSPSSSDQVGHPDQVFKEAMARDRAGGAKAKVASPALEEHEYPDGGYGWVVMAAFSINVVRKCSPLCLLISHQ